MDHSHSDRKVEITEEIVISLTNAQPRLLAFLLKRTGDIDQAHEVLQEINVVICRRSAEFEPGSNFLAWAFSIARFQLMAFRKRQTRDRLTFPEDLTQLLDQTDGDMFPLENDAARHSALQDCLRRLTSRQRELILRRYAECISVKALAAEMDKSANAVSVLLHRIREQLMSCLEHRLREVH